MVSEDWVYKPNCEIPPRELLPSGINRYAACVEYQGQNYSGWQRQQHCPSVQGQIEKALSRVADQQLTVICAGRTDAGVHATNQIIHFDTSASRSERQWLLGINANLPEDISVNWVQAVTPQFHARFSAKSRRYIYLLANTPVKSALCSSFSTWWHTNLDSNAMCAAAQHFIGEHDFSSFRAAGCQARSPVRHVKSARLQCHGSWIAFDIRANAFLHHMVRNIVGTLLAVGEGKIDAADVPQLLTQKNRNLAPPTAPANGLHLVEIEYALKFGLPANLSPPPYLQFVDE